MEQSWWTDLPKGQQSPEVCSYMHAHKRGDELKWSVAHRRSSSRYRLNCAQVHVITGNPCVSTDIHVLHTLSACTLVSSYMLLSTLACKQLNFAMFLDIKIAWRQPHPLATVHELKP